MAEIDLVFAQAPGKADLLFGGEQTGPSPPVEATLSATLPVLTFTARAIPNADFALVTAFPALEMIAEGRYQSYAVRPTIGQTSADWQRAFEFKAGVQDRREATGRDRTLGRARWAVGAARQSGTEDRRTRLLMCFPAWSRAPHRDAVHASPGGHANRHGDTIRLRTARALNYEEAQRAGWMRREARHQDGLHDRRRQTVSGYTEAKRHAGVRQFEAIQSAAYLHRWLGSRWQNALVPMPGVHPADPVPPPVPGACYTPSGALRFAALAATDEHLLFICEKNTKPAPDKEPVIVPVRRVYFVINDVILHRVPDGAEVPAFNLSLSLDAASWAWGFEAVLPATALALVEPGSGPGAGSVELLARVNGTDFHVLAENISRERSFGEASIRLSGRGRNAVLAAPYAPVMNFSNAEARTARQLMDDVLTMNGVPLGWTVDWGLTDWNVPAGVFAHQGTWIEALIAIAGAAGGYLIPHPSEMSLKVRHRYPVAPWEWDTVTPDFVLPAEAVARESLRWLEKPAYNRVFVSGQEVGVLGQVTRAGTAGDVLAPMVVDPLITEAAAARQRGLAVLSDAGHQIEVSLRLPVLAETGIIEPGAFVEYQDGNVTRLGLVRSTGVQAGMPEVWQTLGVQGYA
jgi:hypothetical protein